MEKEYFVTFGLVNDKKVTFIIAVILFFVDVKKVNKQSILKKCCFRVTSFVNWLNLNLNYLYIDKTHENKNNIWQLGFLGSVSSKIKPYMCVILSVPFSTI